MRGGGILYGRARKSKIGEFRAWKQWVESYFGMPYNSVSLKKTNFLVYQTGYNKSIQLSHIPPGNIFAKIYVTSGKFRIRPVPPGNPFPLFPHSPPSRVDDNFGLMDDRPSPPPPRDERERRQLFPSQLMRKRRGKLGFARRGDLNLN